jgi:hypothetical protein
MKELAAIIIGGVFAIAVIVFTAMKIIPVEVFCSLAGVSVPWFYKAIDSILERRK